jgi:hypothetical protein
VPEISLRFHACVIGMEGLATDDEGDYFDGEVEFDLFVDANVHRGLVAKVKQAAGSSFSDPLEVQWPVGFAGRMPYRGFRECVERYVRQQVASRIVGDRGRLQTNIRIHHLRLPAEAACNLRGGGS